MDNIYRDLEIQTDDSFRESITHRLATDFSQVSDARFFFGISVDSLVRAEDGVIVSPRGGYFNLFPYLGGIVSGLKNLIEGDRGSPEEFLFGKLISREAWQRFSAHNGISEKSSARFKDKIRDLGDVDLVFKQAVSHVEWNAFGDYINGRFGEVEMNAAAIMGSHLGVWKEDVDAYFENARDDEKVANFLRGQEERGLDESSVREVLKNAQKAKGLVAVVGGEGTKKIIETIQGISSNGKLVSYMANRGYSPRDIVPHGAYNEKVPYVEFTYVDTSWVDAWIPLGDEETEFLNRTL